MKVNHHQTQAFREEVITGEVFSVLLRVLRAPQCPPCSSVFSVLLGVLRAPRSSPCSSVFSVLLRVLRAPQSSPCSSVFSVLLCVLRAPQCSPCSSEFSVLIGDLSVYFTLHVSNSATKKQNTSQLDVSKS
ncbi:uncharacterized, partial [Tachysurus ichikawai]